MKKKTKQNHSASEEWLNEQFGVEPSPGKSLYELKEDANAKHYILEIAMFKVKERESWIEKRTAALYGLQAAEYVNKKRKEKK